MEQKDKIGIIIIAILLIALLLLLKKEFSNRNRAIASGGPKVDGREHEYHNEESWDVEYNADGMPTKITIHRNALST